MNSPAMPSRRPQRMSASAIQHHLCFFCGDTFSDPVLYQRHMMHEHQSVGVCVQIYHAEKKHEKKKSRRREKKSAAAAAVVAGPSRRHTIADIARKTSAVSAAASAMPSSSPAAPAAVPSRNRGRASPSPARVSREPAPVSAAVCHVPSAGCSAAAALSPACHLCHAHFTSGMHLIEHSVNEHSCSMVAIQVRGSTLEGEFLGERIESKGDACDDCQLQFSHPTRYLLHRIQQHKADMAVDDRWRRIEFTAHLQYRLSTPFTVKVVVARK